MSDFFSAAPPAAPLPPAGTLEPRKVAPGRGWAWISEAFQLVRKQLGMWVLLLLAYLVLYVLIGYVPLLGPLASNLLMPVFVGGLVLAAHKASLEQELELADLFGGFRAPYLKSLLLLGAGYLLLLLGVALAMLLVTLLLGAGFSVTESLSQVGGAAPSPWVLLLLSLVGGAGAVLVLLAFWLAPALVVLSGATPLQALRLSLSAGIRNWLPLLVCGLLLSALLFLAILPVLLGLLLWAPVAHVVGYTAWRDLFV